MLDFILHIDQHLDALTQSYGALTYAVLFLIVFCETGLIVTPFLPGDSMLFAAGAIAARGHLDPHLLALLLVIAAIIGDSLNYAVGNFLGPKVITRQSRWLKKDHIIKTQDFYARYGAKAVVLARFAPIVRTFAPFLAGVGSMSCRKFAMFNVIGAIIWVMLFVYAGFYFGEMPTVKKNFTLIILAIIVISLLPAFAEIIKAKKDKQQHIRHGA